MFRNANPGTPVQENKVQETTVQGVKQVPKWLLPTLSDVLAPSVPTWAEVDFPEGKETSSFPDRSVFQVQEASGFGHSSLESSSQQGRISKGLALRQLRAEREWTGAIAALNALLFQCSMHSDLPTHTIDISELDIPEMNIGATHGRGSNIRKPETGQPKCRGLILSGPSPVLNHPERMKDLSTWTLAANSVHSPHWTTLHLLPAQSVTTATAAPTSVLPLLPGDPLAAEPFCLVMTPGFSLVMVLGETLTEEAAFMFSFEPAVVQRAWETIRPRILLMNSQQVERLDELVQWFSPVTPDYRTVMQFSRLMLQHLPEPLDELCLGQVGNSLVGKTVQNGTTGSPSKTKGRGTLGRQERVISPNRPQVEPAIALSAAAPTHSGNSHSGSSHSGNSHSGNSHSGNSSATSSPGQSLDVELVQAIAHEVRTPLTTIRTLTRSLLKRTDLPPDVLRRLSIIDRECNQQIDRFGLIFRAVELETSAAQQASMSLIRTSLADVFQQSIPRWQQQAGQRQMKLDVLVPQTMPMVVSDPTVLDQALTSLIERFTRNLPAGSHIQVEVTLAGEQLKLQLQSHPEAACNGNSRETGGGGSNAHQSAPKFIGQLLMFQPETGCLSLNLSVTKNLFQAIGGKLTVKQRPQKGEVMTVYLPLEVSGSSLWDSNKIITV